MSEASDRITAALVSKGYSPRDRLFVAAELLGDNIEEAICALQIQFGGPEMRRVLVRWMQGEMEAALNAIDAVLEHRRAKEEAADTRAPDQMAESAV